MSVKLINLTPREINVICPDKTQMVIHPVSTPVKVGCTPYTSVTNFKIPLIWASIKVDLPSPEDGTLYIVNPLVALSNPKRHDLIVPGDFVEDTEEDGIRNFLIFESMAKDEDVWATVASNTSASADVLAALANDEYWKVRCAVASNTSASADVLAALANDIDLRVRCAVASTSVSAADKL